MTEAAGLQQLLDNSLRYEQSRRSRYSREARCPPHSHKALDLQGYAGVQRHLQPGRPGNRSGNGGQVNHIQDSGDIHRQPPGARDRRRKRREKVLRLPQ